MTRFDFGSADQNELATFFSSDFAAAGVWQEDELAEVYRHQLDAPLEADLGDLAITLPIKRAGPQTTFRDLLYHAQPPLQLLVAVKQFAKQQGEEAHAAIPRQVSAVLYLAAISAAMLHCGERITEAGSEALLSKLRWAVARDWIEDSTRKLIEGAIANF